MRLCRVNERGGVTLSWAALKGQFGQEYADTRNFKRKFQGALKKAMDAYKEARIEAVPGGLKLLPSPPPVKRKMITVPAIASADGKAEPALPVACSARLTMQDLVSEAALRHVPALAPGWDKHVLAAIYVDYVNKELGGERPRHRDAAFLGWAKKFTKGKPP